jgi:serine/threonine-protein kinase
VTRLASRLQGALGEKYRVEQVLGSGAYGVVFLATDPRLDRSVAIKVLRPEHATAVSAKRFLHEARCLARLHDPGLTAIHEVGEADGLFFYVMDLVEGETLGQRLAEGPLDPAHLRALADSLLGALHVAHEAGVVHRDVKPSNIFVSEGRIVLADFGIAKTLTSSERSTESGEDETLTREGRFIGTPAYSSPEQLAGQVDDARSDIYSAGVVLFEAATGRRWNAVDPGSESTWAGIPDAMVGVLARALQRRAEDRWASAEEFRVALAEVWDGSQTPDRTRWIPWAIGAVGAGVLWFGFGLAGGGDSTSSGLVGSVAVMCSPRTDGVAADLAVILEDGLRNRLGYLELRVPGRYEIGRVLADSPSDLHAALDVDGVLNCTVVAAPDSVSISGRLIDRAGGQVWGDDFRFESARTYRMADSVTLAVVSEILPHLEGSLRSAPAVGPSRVAVELTGRGRRHWLDRTADPGGEPLRLAEESYRDALARDPTYAVALTGVAQVWLARPARGLATAAAGRDSAHEYALAAIARDSLLPQPVAILAELERMDPFGDWARADSLFRRAIDLGGNHALSRLWYSFYLAQIGNAEAAVNEAHLAFAADRDRPDLSTGLGLVYYLTGDTPAAVTRLGQTLADHPGDFETPLWLAAALIAAGDVEAAGALIDGLAAQPGLPRAVNPMLALGYAVTGRADLARDYLMESGDESPFWQSLAFSYLDDEAEAIRRLDDAVAERDEMLSYARVLPLVGPFREHPRFVTVVSALGSGREP